MHIAQRGMKRTKSDLVRTLYWLPFIVDSSTQTITFILTGTKLGLILTSSPLTLHLTLYNITMTVSAPHKDQVLTRSWWGRGRQQVPKLQTNPPKFIICLYFFILLLCLLLYTTHRKLLSLGNKHSSDSVKKIPQCSFEEVILLSEGVVFIRYFFDMSSWTLILWKGEKQWKLRRLCANKVAAQLLTEARILGSQKKKKSNLITGAGKYTDGYYTY